MNAHVRRLYGASGSWRRDLLNKLAWAAGGLGVLAAVFYSFGVPPVAALVLLPHAAMFTLVVTLMRREDRWLAASRARLNRSDDLPAVVGVSDQLDSEPEIPAGPKQAEPAGPDSPDDDGYAVPDYLRDDIERALDKARRDHTARQWGILQRSYRRLADMFPDAMADIIEDEIAREEHREAEDR